MKKIYRSNAFVKLYSNGFIAENIPDGGKLVKWSKKGNKISVLGDGNITQNFNGAIALSDKVDSFEAPYIHQLQIDARNGNDSLKATDISFDGIYSSMGAGNDAIRAKRLIEFSDIGASDFGLDLGDGDDTIDLYLNGSPNNAYTDVGIILSGDLRAGSGNDIIRSEISLYSGAGFSRASGVYLDSNSYIDMGPGNDVITGISSYQNDLYVSQDSGIFMGEGDDRIDALTGGIYLAGSIDLGAGNDTAYLNLKQSVYTTNIDNASRFDGGDGQDTLYLTEGYYVITRDSRYQNVFAISGGTFPFYVNNFESVGNAETGAVATLHAGSLYVIDGGLFSRVESGDNIGDFVPF